jgi:hypothetical protein
MKHATKGIDWELARQNQPLEAIELLEPDLAPLGITYTAYTADRNRETLE